MADNDDLIISISTDMAAVRRALKRLGDDIASTSSKVEKQFDKMGKGIDNSMVTALQTRIDKMVGIGTQGAKEWTGALADQGKELERLRARYNPLFSTINNYKAAVSDIRRAHALGAISATEMTVAITKERQAALASTAAIKGRNAALADTPVQRGGGGAFNTANLAAQFQDIGVTAAMGMSPLQIALQQGTQISAVLGPMGAAGAVKSLGAAFLSVINPVSLVTIGLVAASAAAIQYFGSMDWGGEKSEETLKKEAELIDAVTQKWGEALPALKAYNDARKATAEGTDIKAASAVEADKQWEDLRKQVDDVNIALTDTASQLQQLGKDEGQVGNLQRDFNTLKDAIADGTANSEMARKVQQDLKDLIKDGSTPAIDAFVKSLDNLPSALDRASGSAKKLIDQGTKLAETLRIMDLLNRGGSSQDGVQNYRLRDQLRRDRENANPTVINGDGKLTVPGVPGAKPIQLGDEPDKKTEKAVDSARKAYDALIKSADDRIGQLRLETELLGQYGAETDAARFRLDLLQQSEDKGRSLSSEQKAAIEEKVAAYKKYSEALSEAKLKQDMLDANRLAGMSKIDQNIIETQKSYGLPQDVNSESGKALRNQINREDIANTTASFLSEFSNSVVSGGKDIGEAFVDALKNAAANAMQKSLESLFGQIGNALASALTGGKGASPAASVASAASTFAAPVGAVSKAALPAAMPSGDIANYISKAAAARGIDPATALAVAKSEGGLKSWNLQSGVMKNGVQEPSFGPFQLYKGGGLGNDFMRKTGMDPALAQNGPAGVDFALDHASKNGWGAWYGAKNTGIGNWEGIGKGAGSASAALEKLAGASTETTKGLGSLANSLVSGGAGGGASLGGFANLFSSSFKPNTTLSAFLGVGANAKGTDSWSGGPTWVGEDGPEIINAPKGAQIIPNHAIRKVSAPVAPRLNSRAPAAANQNGPTALNVNIAGASGDPHVRELVRQGVAEALAAKNDNDRRGGFGMTQQRFTSQKG